MHVLDSWNHRPCLPICSNSLYSSWTSLSSAEQRSRENSRHHILGTLGAPIEVLLLQPAELVVGISAHLEKQGVGRVMLQLQSLRGRNLGPYCSIQIAIRVPVWNGKLDKLRPTPMCSVQHLPSFSVVPFSRVPLSRVPKYGGRLRGP